MNSADSGENCTGPGSCCHPTANFVNISLQAGVVLCQLLHKDVAQSLLVKTVEGITDGWGQGRNLKTDEPANRWCV